MRAMLRAGGARTSDAWDGALAAFPVDPKVMKEVRRDRMRATKESLKRQRDERRAMLAKVIGGEVKERTGVKLIDWIYANLDVADGMVGEPEGKGDFGLLRYYRENRGEFYGKVYGPAMMKRGGGLEPLAAVEGAEERMLREMGERNGSENGKAVE